MSPLHTSIDADVYRFVRGVVFGSWAVILLLDPVERLAELPVAAFELPGILSLVPRDWIAAAWTPAAFAALRLAGAALCLAATVRKFWGLAPVACAALYCYQTSVRGFGYVNHSETQLLLAAFVLTAFGIADRLAPAHRELARLRAIPFACMAALISFTYFGSGLNRLVSSGPAGILDGSLAVYMVETSGWDSLYQFEFASTAAFAIPIVLINAGFLAVTVVEVCAPIGLLSRRARNWILPALVCFHCSTFILMKIIFLEQLLLLALFWTDWPHRFVAKRRSKAAVA